MKTTGTISRARFEGVAFGFMMLLTIAGTILLSALDAWLRFPLHYWMGILPGLTFVLSRPMADRILRRSALSRSGRTSEVRSRGVVLSEADDVDRGVLEFHWPWAVNRLAMGIHLVTGLGATLMLIDSSRHERGAEVQAFCWFMIAACVLVMLYLGYWRDWGRPIFRLDANGILGYPAGFWWLKPHPRFIPWPEVAACEIETRYDVFGSAAHVLPIFMDAAGRELLRLDLRYVPRTVEEQAVQYIRVELPKTREDYWE